MNGFTTTLAGISFEQALQAEPDIDMSLRVARAWGGVHALRDERTIRK